MTLKNGPSENENVRRARNEDPITGEPGSHPVGTGVGAVLGGAAAGAAAGAVGGPIGAAVGVVAGGVAGAYAGKAVAEEVDPTIESAYWRENFEERPYYRNDYTYEDYEPAYQSGWEMEFQDGDGTSWDQREAEARRRWEEYYNDNEIEPLMTWEDAKYASKDAYQRIAERHHAAITNPNKPR